MSIFVKNVDWSQTETEIILIVPINGKKSIENVIIAEKFLKINVHPYFYEVFFEHPISIGESTCKALQTCFKFRLKKTNNELWASLGKTAKPVQNSVDGTISLEKKKELFLEYEKSVNDARTIKKTELANLKRDEIDKEVERASRIRNKVDDFEEALKNVQIKNDEDFVKKPIKKIFVKEKTLSTQNIKNEISSMPPIRSCAKINVNLSTREFVTPKRESQEQAEREWCAKQHEIIVNRIGFDDKDLNTEERDLNWLIQKGNGFLEKKNYLAAVSAFTCGLKMSNESPELFFGRAVAQYALKNYKHCAEDSSDALERFKPAVESNLMSRIHCFWLRGKSLICLGLKEHGNREIQMATQLDPHNFDKYQEHFMKDTFCCQ